MRLLLLLLILLTPVWAQAQTTGPATPTDFQLLLFPATADPLTAVAIRSQTTTIGPSSNCGLDPTTIGPTPPPPPGATNPVNPLLFALDDPFTANKKCRLSFPTGLPAGNYTWAGVFGAQCVSVSGTVACTGARTVGSPVFSIADLRTAPPAPTGLRLTQ